MSHFHRMILRMLPGPFLGWMSMLVFLLVMQFLIKYLPVLVGKGLPVSVILELIVYNLSYMLVLAVPMATLISTLMTFGRLAETKAYTVIKGAGVSFPQLLWPVLVAGLCLSGGMWYFNNEILPESNFRASTLWKDIKIKKPGFALQPGVFYEDIDQYKIMAQEIPSASNDLYDVVIYDYSENPTNRVDIKASRGHIAMRQQGEKLELTLYNGEIHRRKPPRPDAPESYERLRFQQHRLTLDLNNVNFERRDANQGRRSDRTMRTADMIRLVDSLDLRIEEEKEELRQEMAALANEEPDPEMISLDPPPLPAPAIGGLQPSKRLAMTRLDSLQHRRIYDEAIQRIRVTRTRLDNTRRTLTWQIYQSAKYKVEIHKKYSLALACLIFVLIGAPLGLSIRRGGLGTAGALAIGIFIFYWATLVQGEKLADRGLLDPWVGMWAANLVTLAVGIWLVFYITIDLSSTPPLHRRFQQWYRNRS